MLSKINRTEGLGLVFQDFRWAAATAPFKKFNLIYGWNGCGKTTLTRLFDLLSAPDGASGVSYFVETDDGQSYSETDTFPSPVRVFNQHYVSTNVRVLESATNKISVLLGEQNQELLRQIEADETTLNGVAGDTGQPGLLREHQGLSRKAERLEKENNAAFTEIAKAISAATTGAGLATRSYRAPEAKRDFAALAEPAPLTERQLETNILSLRQTLLPEEPLLTFPQLDSGDAAPDVVDKALATAARILPQTVTAVLIERLAANPDIAEWVEQGIKLHTTHGSPSCEYCGNEIPTARITEFAEHFNDADRAMKADIEETLSALRQAYALLDKFQAPDTRRLYDELQPEYQTALDGFEEARRTVLQEVTGLGESFKQKRSRPGEALSLPVAPNTSGLRASLAAVNDLLGRHNAKSQEFEKQKRATAASVTNHYLSTIHEDVSKRSSDLNELRVELERRRLEISEVRERIATHRAAISSDHHACDQINQALCAFLGRNELRFVPDEGDPEKPGTVTGYRILRGEEPATHLSEGERTAVAFVYFVVHLADGQFDTAKGIVVVDDPMSSLDSNSVYQAFSYLKNAVKDCGQVFVFTHNFEFLKLLLTWREYAHLKRQTGYYMVNNVIENGVRQARIEPMDKELCEYESEYHYLFKTLRKMQAEQNGSVAAAYPIANIARKLWETYLMFRVPDGKRSMHSKMQCLKDEGYDANTLDAIAKFTNDNSHLTGGGFNPALVEESRKVVAQLLDMMKNTAPDHYRVLEEATA